MRKQAILALAMLVGSLTFAQKDELKSASKAIKQGNFADAKTAVNQAEPMIASADDKTQAEFYYLKGQAYYANGTASAADMSKAIESLNMVEKVEKESGKNKYTEDVKTIKGEMLTSFLTKANSALEAKDYSKSSVYFDQAYRMSPKDTLYLYYAASTAVSAQDYDTSLKMYEELRDLGYSGAGVNYVATNKETGEVESFDNKNMRDISVKAGTHIAPSQKKTESKSAEIIKNIALIYVSQDKNEKAIEAMKAARAENPDDLSLILTEANVQLKMGNREAFKKLMEEATTKDPKNPELQYNLGVIAAESGDAVAAEKYYNKAIALDPGYADAYNNLAVLTLGKEESIIEEMNGLGNSAADNKRYDELKKEREDLYRNAIPYLEKTLELKPDNISAARTLMNIYSALGETDKFKAMKSKVEEMENQ
ncbi:tetratricopeptide repeat protein [Aegicerativicinus sediminis]|uniref:tetratricopeptide repeat protein n=1 Tax=Aegicerativicinus sediminis TaxID=2893202 RepID=UPI001E62D66A|nr:tetratricopeptide repeat protein [Aegicerativicinus sediminis]